jgi:hypothetical protein
VHVIAAIDYLIGIPHRVASDLVQKLCRTLKKDLALAGCCSSTAKA